jgi:anaerobic selenocysteine-containing dehydrogenase
MDRRSFIKLTAVTGTAAGLASCGNPEHTFIRFLPEDEITPGVADWKPSVCPACGGGCGVTARVMDADVDVIRKGQAGVMRMPVVKKLEGIASHPISQGGLCARGQASIQITYHPDRLRHPMKRTGNRGAGQFQEVTWDAAIAELVSHLDALEGAGNQKALAYLTRRRTGQRHTLVEQFAAKFGAPAPIAYELFGDDVLRHANGMSFGREQLPTFDIARSRFVLSFGADFLGTWNSPVSQGAAYGAMRQGRPGVRASFVQVEPRMTQTGANADEWVPCTPGTEGALALAIAHVILKEKLRPADGGRAGSLIGGWGEGLADFAPEKVEKLTGVAAKRIERIARTFADMRPAVAIVGGAPLAHTNGLFTALAVNALNALSGNVGEPGGLYFTPVISHQSSVGSHQSSVGTQQSSVASQSLKDWAAAAASQVVLIDGANPVFTAPKAWKVREAIEKASFVASFGSFIDDTSALADLILPDHSFLESWVDAVPESGSLVSVMSVAPPAMKPIHDTRATADVLLDVASKLKKPLSLGATTYDAMIKASFASLPAGADGTDAWTLAQKQGGWWGDVPKGQGQADDKADKGKAAKNVAFAAAQFDGDAGQYPFHFLPYPSSMFLDGSLAHLPWLQEQPDPITSAMWSTWVEINPTTAQKLGIKAGDVVEVASSQGSVKAGAVLSPGIAPDVIAMPVGQGHQNFTRFASGRGDNPVAILASVAEPETGSLAWAATRVKASRVSGPDGKLIMYAGSLREEGDMGR